MLNIGQVVCHRRVSVDGVTTERHGRIEDKGSTFNLTGDFVVRFPDGHSEYVASGELSSVSDPEVFRSVMSEFAKMRA